MSKQRMSESEFRALHAPKGKRSSLAKHETVILGLIADEFSYRQVAEYLEGVTGGKVNHSNVARFVKRTKKRKATALPQSQTAQHEQSIRQKPPAAPVGDNRPLTAKEEADKYARDAFKRPGISLFPNTNPQKE